MGFAAFNIHLDRHQARILRWLLEHYLKRLKRNPPPFSAQPTKPGTRHPEWLLHRMTVENLERLLPKLKRLERQ
jgi:hypothetical protein